MSAVHHHVTVQSVSTMAVANVAQRSCRSSRLRDLRSCHVVMTGIVVEEASCCVAAGESPERRTAACRSGPKPQYGCILLSQDAGQDAESRLRCKANKDAQQEAGKHKPVPLHCISEGHLMEGALSVELVKAFNSSCASVLKLIIP